MSEVSFLTKLNASSSQSIQSCYHCHKCTAGCPVAGDMEYGPDRVLRMVQMGEREKLLKSHDIWLCASCQTCGTRCPNEIDIARVMDALRSEALQAGIPSAEPDAVKFNKLFLLGVETFGRSHEASMLIAYKLWTLNLVADMDSGMQMFFKGKVPVVPKLVKNRQQIKQIFEGSKSHLEADPLDDGSGA